MLQFELLYCVFRHYSHAWKILCNDCSEISLKLHLGATLKRRVRVVVKMRRLSGGYKVKLITLPVDVVVVVVVAPSEPPAAVLALPLARLGCGSA